MQWRSDTAPVGGAARGENVGTVRAPRPVGPPPPNTLLSAGCEECSASPAAGIAVRIPRREVFCKRAAKTANEARQPSRTPLSTRASRFGVQTNGPRFPLLRPQCPQRHNLTCGPPAACPRASLLSPTRAEDTSRGRRDSYVGIRCMRELCRTEATLSSPWTGRLMQTAVGPADSHPGREVDTILYQGMFVARGRRPHECVSSGSQHAAVAPAEYSTDSPELPQGWGHSRPPGQHSGQGRGRGRLPSNPRSRPAARVLPGGEARAPRCVRPHPGLRGYSSSSGCSLRR